MQAICLHRYLEVTVRTQNYTITGTFEKLGQLLPVLCQLLQDRRIESFSLVGDSVDIGPSGTDLRLTMGLMDEGTRREQIQQELDILNKIEATGCVVL